MGFCNTYTSWYHDDVVKCTSDNSSWNFTQSTELTS